ncbi:hypothetical protein RND81_10G147500 [Saponaria officinalis]|uniref:Uncharacterized protein n=1 Tax=Saponaria officinalis TaxID=3572 RepID=A0AAW1I251_SAPOF
MGENKETHIVEIPNDQEKIGNNALTISSAIQQHPMMEISQSPGHFLLLKLWQREEDVFARRITMKETKLDSIRQEIFQLCCIFFLFHGFFSTILFISSVNHETDNETHLKCRKWWIPSLLSILTSMVVAFLVHLKLHKYWKVAMRLKREMSDNRALTRCTQELRMKGASFDLSKVPQISNNINNNNNNNNNIKRIKSSSVEIKWKPITWCSHYLVTLCLVLFAGLAFPAPKLFLCIF